MEKSKLSSLLKRVLSTLVMAPIVIGAIVAGWNTTVILLLLVCSILAWEWSTMVSNKNQTIFAVTYLMTAAATFSFSDIFYPLILMIVSSLFVWWKAKGETYRQLLVFGVPYIALGIGAMAWFYTLFGPLATLWLLLAVWSVDIGGYVVGCTVKGPKLAPKISPNKTWSGLLGAMIFAIAVSFAFAYYNIPGYENTYIYYVIFGAALAVVAQAGDLLESKIKRVLNVKDSSNLIPGHGGMFDRIDGLLVTAPVLLIVLYVMYINAVW